jgi:hypothetical protein
MVMLPRLGRYDPMEWLRHRLARTDTWLVIAILALGGWTLDAVRFFLGMHDSLFVGFGAFASHFWFALPVAVAIMVLARSQPRTRLLGVAAYDEAGREVYHQGDFHLDALNVRTLLGPSHGRERGLHTVTLPSGARVYFLKEGGSTILLSFSGAASLEEVTAGREQVRRSLAGNLELLEGLRPEVALLATALLRSPVYRRTLSFFSEHERATVPLEEAIARVGGVENEVRGAIQALIEVGLVECQTVCELVFCRLARDPAQQMLLDELIAWQEQWQEKRRRLEYLVG